MRLYIIALIIILTLLLLVFVSFKPSKLESSEETTRYEYLVRPALLAHIERPAVFFRDDDFFTLDGKAEQLVELFMENEVPLAIGVIPYDVTKEAATWLTYQQQEHPELIQIDMHAYRHTHIGASVIGEFRNRRDDNVIYHEIESGKQLMNRYFNNWSYIFTVPFSEYDNKLIDALHTAEFRGLSAHHPKNLIREKVIHRWGALDYST